MLPRSIRESKGFAVFVVCVAVFSDVFTYGIIVPVFPFALTERLGVPEEDVQKWNSILLGVLGISIIIGGIIFGYLSDLIRSRRLPFTLGLAMLGSATVLFALCRTLWLLIVARTLQGLSTAVVVTVGYALVFDKVGPKQIGQAMGYTSMCLSMGWFIGPVVGGVIYEHAGYLAVFAPPVILVAIEIVLRLLVIESKVRAPTDAKTPPLLEEGNPADETSALLPRPEIETSSTHRNAFVVLLSSPRFVVGVLGFCIVNGLGIAFDGVLPVYIKEVYDFNSEQVSLVFLALTAPMLLSPLFGELTDRMSSTKWPAVAGFLICVPGLLLMRLTGAGEKSDFALLIILLIVVGIGFSIAHPPIAAEVMHAVDEIEKKNPGIFGAHGASAQAYGLTNAGLGVGCIIGPLGAGFVRVRWGWATTVTCLAVISALMAILCMLVTGGPLGKRKIPEGESTEETNQSSE